VWRHSVAARVCCRSGAAGQTAARGARIVLPMPASWLLDGSCRRECGRHLPRRTTRVRNVAAGWRGGDVAWGSVMLLRGVHIAAAMAAQTAAAATTPAARSAHIAARVALRGCACPPPAPSSGSPAQHCGREGGCARHDCVNAAPCGRVGGAGRDVCGWPRKRLCAALVIQQRGGHEPRSRSLRLLNVVAAARVSTFAGGSGSPLAMNAAIA
jgi:hypothetical protein